MHFYSFDAILSKLKRCVAQFGRALRSGRRGRRFKSCRIDFGEKPEIMKISGFFVPFRKLL